MLTSGDSPIHFSEDSLDLFRVGGLQLLVESASFGIKTSAALKMLDLRLSHSLDTLSKTLKHCLHILQIATAQIRMFHGCLFHLPLANSAMVQHVAVMQYKVVYFLLHY